jgi:hypothetical protein
VARKGIDGNAVKSLGSTGNSSDQLKHQPRLRAEPQRSNQSQKRTAIAVKLLDGGAVPDTIWVPI